MAGSPLLPTRSLAKPWGRAKLPAPFVAPPGERIGEVWFEPPAALDRLLVKHIFSSEALSVQVHPSDDQTLAAGLGRQGKEECWLVIDAEPGASLGIGFERAIDAAALRAAAVDGSIEQLLTWHPVRAGDFFYIPANTVHAIGAGISLIEIQQNRDITYRLYDYGRPRELHLEAGMAVARGEPYPARWRQHLPARGEVTLVEGPLFRLDRIDGPASPDLRASYADHPLLVIPRSAGIAVGGIEIPVGGCALAPELGAVSAAAGAQALLTRPL